MDITRDKPRLPTDILSLKDQNVSFILKPTIKSIEQ